MKKKSPSRQDYTFVSFHDLLHKILFYAHQGSLITEFLGEISRLLLNFSRGDGLEIWVLYRSRIFYCRCAEHQEGHYQVDIVSRPDTRKKSGGKTRRREGAHERFYRDVAGNSLPFTDPGFIKKGGIYIGDFDECRDFNPRGNAPFWPNCFHSTCVIPLLIVSELSGFLQLHSREPHYFSGIDMSLYEDVANTLGVALAHRAAQLSVRERVKELTCLYEIAHMTGELKGILQQITGLLPQAWLYPHIASARIVLDGETFAARNFRESVSRQRSEIMVQGVERGFVEVVYLTEKPELDEGPFLREERNLIDTVAKEISSLVERKTAEAERHRSQEQLRHADRLATLGQLAAGVAHEINEPLGSILGFAQLALKDTGLPGQVARDIEKIVNASLHAREVVRKLLLFARQSVPRKSRVHINQLVVEGLYFFSSRCNKLGIRLVLELAESIPEFIVDPGQIQQVLINLVVNAIQAMPGGGTLTIRTLAEDESIVMVVEDTGIGMGEETISEIFAPFFTTKDVGEGTGLGLTVVHGIISSHGGGINVESRPGSGTRFTIRVPLAEDNIHGGDADGFNR